MKYVLDVTFSEPYSFCPFEEPGAVVVGLSIVSGTCPGELVGVYHADGENAVNKWIKDNPNWFSEHSSG